MTRQIKRFTGIAALVAMMGFLMLPVMANASEPPTTDAVSQLGDEVQASHSSSQSSFEEALVDSGAQGPPADVSATDTAEDSSARPVPEIQLSMANPFGRTVTMGGRH